MSRAAFLVLPENKTPYIADGVRLQKDQKGQFIGLPIIEGVNPRKSKVYLDKFNPAETMDNGTKIYEVFLKIYGGQRFKDAGAFVTAQRATTTEKVALFTFKRWPQIEGFKMLKGRPNGEFPGVQIMSEGDQIQITHNDEELVIHIVDGEPWISKKSEMCQEKSQPSTSQPQQKILKKNTGRATGKNGHATYKIGDVVDSAHEIIKSNGRVSVEK